MAWQVPGLQLCGYEPQAGKGECLQFFAALREAQDVHMHLMPLCRQLESLEGLEFAEVKPRLQPLLHVVCLIWATCKSYRSPGRLTVLLQEICNLLIKQVGCPRIPSDLPLGAGWHRVTGKSKMYILFRAGK